MSEITMPSLSDSMEEGTILKWLASDGDTISPGQELLEVETDKATMTVECEVSGVLRILVSEGATVSVGTVIAQAGDPAAPEPAPAQAPEGAPAHNGQAAGAPAGMTPAAANGGHAATPLARRAAREHGVRLAELTGTGPRGRITRADVFAAAGLPVPAPAPAAPAPAAPAPVPAAPAAKAPPGEPVALTRIQQLIARRMSESRTAIPEFEVQCEVAMDAALALRAQLRAVSGEDPAPSVNDLIVKAVALALRAHPALNASWVDDAPRRHEAVHVGVAVATDDALIVPTVRDADSRSLGSLAAQTRRLAARVRDGEITPEELSGATFTVSNLGMFGMTAIRPIINAPQVGILGVGMAREVLARVEGEIVTQRLMTVTLSCDHRAVYGADAARFLSDVRALLQEPLRLLL